MSKPVTPNAPHGEPVEPRTPFAIDLKTAAQLGAEAAGVTLVNVPIPDDMPGLPSEVTLALVRGEKPEVRDLTGALERYRLHPARKKGTAQAQTLESFFELTNRHKTGDSVIFADCDWTKPSFTAVIDYHEHESGGAADWLSHRVHYAFPLSEEWKAWRAMDGQPMDQEKFAWFLEDRVPELASPTEHEKVTLEHQFQSTLATPAQVVELSRGLRVHIASQVKNARTLQTGEGQIAWEETHTDGDGKPLKVPGLFMLSLAPFFMGEPVRIPVRLRYRPNGAKITWQYQMYRPDLAITEHVRHALAEARETTALPAYEGKPEA